MAKTLPARKGSEDRLDVERHRKSDEGEHERETRPHAELFGIVRRKEPAKTIRVPPDRKPQGAQDDDNGNKERGHLQELDTHTVTLDERQHSDEHEREEVGPGSRRSICIGREVSSSVARF